MSTLKEGMYVRASVDYEDELNPRMFATGQIKEIKGDRVLVEFYRNFYSVESSIIYDYIPSERWYDEDSLTRIKLLKDTKVTDYLSVGKILINSGKNTNNFFEYYIKNNTGKILKVSEDEICADFNRGDINPCYQMGNYEFHNPFWYAKRIIASEAINMINNFDLGFKTLIGSRVFLFEHQIDTIVRALDEEVCRLMLADEVGLGKTVEALVIIKGLKKKNERVLIIVPESLVYQWKNELEYKFWDKSVIYNGSNLNHGDIVIASLKQAESISINLKNKLFDYCIIDEVHRTIHDENLYKRILKICKTVKNILLLSATPIESRQEEYLKLLTLLKPEQYESITEKEFSDLLNKNYKIKKVIHRIMGNLSLAYGNEYDEDEIEDIFDYLEEISEELEDRHLDKLVKELDIDSEDKSESIVYEALAYISTNYQFEKNIIRHRREEIKEFLPERDVETIYYEMKSSSDNFNEYNCYESLINYIETIKINNNWTIYTEEYIRMLINAMFSSPYALKSVISFRKKILDNKEKIYNYDDINGNRISIVRNIPMFPQEGKYISDIEYNLDIWINQFTHELSNINNLMDNPDLIKGRIGKIIDYIEQELYDKKVVIFTSWIETLEVLKSSLLRMYGEGSVVTFCSKDTANNLEKNVYEFQNNSKCRIMICDELGGEGRNFQIADAIIHVDIPFSPTVLEQRIGRLDRVGRDKNKKVLNVVTVAVDTIELSLFDLWHKGLNIFSESLSGIEIALEDINNEVLSALKENINYGLSDALECIKNNLSSIKSSIEEEKYFDMAQQLDYFTKKRYASIINHFDNNGGKLLAEIMLNWSLAVGFTPSFSENGIVEFNSTSINDICMEHTMFAIPNTKEILERSKKKNCIRGTFDRRLAVDKEDLVFFAPGDPIFDSIINNVQEGYRGRSSAINISNAPFNWEGFIFRYNTSFSMRELLDNGYDDKYRNYAYGHMPVEQFLCIIPIEDYGIDVSRVRSFVQDQLPNLILKNNKAISHIGKRGGVSSNLNIFKRGYSTDSWRRMLHEANIKSLEELRDQYKESIDIKRINREFKGILAGAKANKEYFDSSVDLNKLKSILQSVYAGIVKCEKTLDSVIYLKMEK